MKKEILLRLCALGLSVCTAISSLTAVQIVRAYAGEAAQPVEGRGDLITDDMTPEEIEKLLHPDQPGPAPTPQPDPFDYNVIASTPTINFGVVNQGDVVQAQAIVVGNNGYNPFPLTWEEIDQYTAFDIGTVSETLDLEPQQTAVFTVSPRQDLGPGTYTAKYTFYSANDIRRHHTAVVNVTMTVKAAAPAITDVVVSPGEATVPAGKSFHFDAYVSGINGFDDSVTWSVLGNQASGTTIDGDGNLTISPFETAGGVAVIATSRQDSSMTGNALVSISSSDHLVSARPDPIDGGAVSGFGAVRDGGSITLSASPNNNYVFQGWFENGNLVSSDWRLTINNVTDDHDLVARFSRNGCYVRTSVNNGDLGYVSPGGSVGYGGSFTIQATPKPGFNFDGFYENNRFISRASTLTINNITGDRNILAVFSLGEFNVKITVDPQDTGKVEGGGRYDYGSNIEVKASAYDGYQFTGWTINGQVVSTDNRYVVKNLRSDVNIVANFMKKSATTYKLTSGVANAGGSVIPGGDYVVAEGGSVTYNIVPQSDYRINAVIVDGNNIGTVASYTFNNVKGNHTITASFEKIPQQAPAQPQKTDAPSAPAQQSAQPAKPATSQPAVKPKEEAPRQTDYNENTAAEGAVPKQDASGTQVPQEVTVLEGEQYQDDVFTPAEEIPATSMAMATGVMARHNLDEDTLRILISDNAVTPLLKEAFEDGTLQITVNNSYAADPQETAVETYYSKPTLLNFENVIEETMTPDEKFDVLTGKTVSYNIDITENTATVDELTKSAMQKKVGYRPVSFFDFHIMKTADGTTSEINSTATELEVELPIPEQYMKQGRKFYIIREHNGEVDVLQDIGIDPTTVTFKTDRFSQYALAYEAVNVNKLILRFSIIAIVSFILAVVCFISLVRYKRNARRALRASKRSK
ncbi:MAG: InlB B-repeat-containing protein [Butyrivibrio sp.]|nr:InlB B-repeat-containing protein [Butyrivibrio sp.]